MTVRVGRCLSWIPSIALLVPLLGMAIPAPSAQAQPPAVYPADGEYVPVTCSDPTSIPSSDSCSDIMTLDHRSIVGGGSTPAYLVANDGTYLFLRLRTSGDPTQATGFVSFAWGFGLDADGDGEFEAYITLIGQGNSDRVEILDQDPDNGVTPDISDANGTALLPIMNDGSSATYATSTDAGANFCPGDSDGGDFYITVAIPLTLLNDFGVLGAVVAYGGSSSQFSGIQNDFVCADGDPGSCTDGTMCPSGICLLGEGICGPPVDPFFIGCLDQDISPVDSIDDGCTAATPQCIIGSSGSRCVECESAADCDDSTDCTTDTCTVSNTCSNVASPAGSTCAGGICDGSSSVNACVACVDDAPGASADTGCASAEPVCDTSGAAPICVACLDDTARGMDTGCAASASVCDTSGASNVCVTCQDDLGGAGQDDGCGASTPLCDTSGASAICVACSDSTVGGIDLGCASAAPSCDTSGAAPICLPCLDDAGPGLRDDGCAAPTAICDTSGAANACVGCLSDGDCAGGTCDLGAQTCSACLDDGVGIQDSGCGAVSPVCDTSAALAFCVDCEDNASAASTDFGCTSGSPLCDVSGAAPTCAECFDTISHGMDTGCSGATQVCDVSGASSVCATCLDDSPAGVADDGCAGATPACDSSISGGACVGCLADADCATGVCDVSSNVCVACRDDSVGSIDSGCSAAAAACDTSGATAICAPCIDSAPAGSTDDGCSGTTTICDTSAATNVCVGCFAAADCGASAPICASSQTCVICSDDTSGGTDTGCMAAAPACDETGTPVCLTCEDTASGSSLDNGCSSSTPICDDSGATLVCVRCLSNSDCPSSAPICGAANTCLPGCTDDSHCAGTPTTPICDTTQMACVQCLRDAQCLGEQMCATARVCHFGDNDADGVPDDIDLDDDNDGIPDLSELGGADLSVDSDSDGILDYRDASIIACTDGDGDGACDTLPPGVDQDGDGVPNHYDLDADNDGIVDLIEGGGVDTDADGRADGFTDADNDGLHDAFLAAPLPLPNTDGDSFQDFLDLDDDGDGLTDTEEAGGMDTDGDGHIDGFTDGNRDGLHDALLGNSLPRPDTDADGTPDYLDLDSDADGLPDATEGTDANGDGTPDRTPSGADADNDGLDDAFDPSEGGMRAPLPDHDGDTRPDYQDVDDDGDGIETSREVIDGMTHGNDVDSDGIPNWFDENSDGDAFNDSEECAAASAACADADSDGVPDYLDPATVSVDDGGVPDGGVDGGVDAGTQGGFSGGAVCSASPGAGDSPLSLLSLLILGLGLLVRRRRRTGR